MNQTNLLSNLNRVETPFIGCKIGEYTFGIYNQQVKEYITLNNRRDVLSKINYPNYMQSLTIEKINGSFNTYTLNMIYVITKGDDPNLLERVFASVGYGGTIILSYGDLSAPNFIYKNEEAIITKITKNVNIQSSQISYTLYCTSKSMLSNAGKLNFRQRFAKPSDVIKDILFDSTYGLLDIFTGMRNKQKVLQKSLIASDDKPVKIQAKNNLTILEYLNYLVSCMTYIGDGNSLIDSSKYVLNVIDELSNEFDGPYFKVTRLIKSTNNESNLNMYEIDIGSFSKDLVLGFTVDENETYSVLYQYANKIEQSNYVYRIDNNGNITYQYSPALSTDSTLLTTTQADKN